MWAWLRSTASSVRGLDRRRRPVALAQRLQALEEAAVEQHAARSVLEQVLGAGDGAAGTPEKGQGWLTR